MAGRPTEAIMGQTKGGSVHIVMLSVMIDSRRRFR